MDKIKKIESESNIFEPCLAIKNLHIKICLVGDNMCRAELKRKGGEKFVGYGGYPTEALDSLIYCLKFRRDFFFINEALIHDEWE